MIAFAASLILLVLGAFASLVPRSFRTANALGAYAAMAGCGLGLIAAIQALIEPQGWALAVAWPPPWGLGRFAMDGISAFFLAPAFLLCGLGAAYGRGYLAHTEGHHRAGPP